MFLKFTTMKKITITEKEWNDNRPYWKEWESKVFITKWEHDYTKKIYNVDYREYEDTEPTPIKRRTFESSKIN